MWITLRQLPCRDSFSRFKSLTESLLGAFYFLDIGSHSRVRTYDIKINNFALYQLSYMGFFFVLLLGRFLFLGRKDLPL